MSRLGPHVMAPPMQATTDGLKCHFHIGHYSGYWGYNRKSSLPWSLLPHGHLVCFYSLPSSLALIKAMGFRGSAGSWRNKE